MRNLIESTRDLLSEMRGEYEIYHETYTDAVQEVIRYVEKEGYKVREDDRFNIVGTGTKRPGIGKTTTFSLPLYKRDGETPAGKKIEVQIYGMAKKYELNMYFGKAGRDMY